MSRCCPPYVRVDVYDVDYGVSFEKSLQALSKSSIQVGSPRPVPGFWVAAVGVIEGCGVRVGKTLGVMVIVQVGSGVRVG